MKDNIYKCAVRDLDHLTELVTEELKANSSATLHCTHNSLMDRLVLLVHADGGHIEHLM